MQSGGNLPRLRGRSGGLPRFRTRLVAGGFHKCRAGQFRGTTYTARSVAMVDNTFMELGHDFRRRHVLLGLHLDSCGDSG